jgi:hypothetical protein
MRIAAPKSVLADEGPFDPPKLTLGTDNGLVR